MKEKTPEAKSFGVTHMNVDTWFALEAVAAGIQIFLKAEAGYGV